MLIRSSRIPTKWDPPVTTNIAARPPRSAVGQLRSRRTPAAPAARSVTVTTMRTNSGVMADLLEVSTSCR